LTLDFRPPTEYTTCRRRALFDAKETHTIMFHETTPHDLMKQAKACKPAPDQAIIVFRPVASRAHDAVALNHG
jgi:hypothetical protein